jgi:hypothetical protein
MIVRIFRAEARPRFIYGVLFGRDLRGARSTRSVRSRTSSTRRGRSTRSSNPSRSTSPRAPSSRIGPAERRGPWGRERSSRPFRMPLVGCVGPSAGETVVWKRDDHRPLLAALCGTHLDRMMLESR